MKKLLIILMSVLVLMSCGGSSGGGGGGGTEKDIECTETYCTIKLNRSIAQTIDGNELKEYRFTTSDAGSYTISLTQLGSDIDWYLEDISGVEIEYSITYGTDDEIKTVVLEGATTYILHIEEYDSVSSSFYIQVSVDTNDDDSDSDSTADDSGHSYISISLDTQYNETIDGSGTREYSFTTMDTGPYTISITNMESDLDWYIYELSGDRIEYSNDAGTDDEIMNVILTSSTTYILFIREYSGESSSFTLEVAVTDFQTLALETTYNDTLWPWPNSYKFYKFTTSTAGDYTITIPTRESNMGCVLYDSKGASVYEDSFYALNFDPKVVNLEGNSDYFLFLETYTSFNNSFSLEIGFSE